MPRAIYAIAVVAALLEGAYSQVSVKEVVPPTCDYTELYRKDGWAIPGIKGAKKKWRVATPGKQEVYMTELEPTTHASTIQSFRCSRDHAGRLEIEDIQMGIEYLSAFDVGGRTFAYSLSYGVDGVAASWLVTFYDLDGSGHFTLRRGERSRFVPELFPDWVKDSKDVKTRPGGSQVVPKNVSRAQ